MVRCEEKPISSSLRVKVESPLAIDNIILTERVSSLGKKLRITAYVYKNNARRASNEDRTGGLVSENEQNIALNYWIKYEQQHNFGLEHKSNCEKKQNIMKESKIISLKPFVDTEVIMRVRGRIVNSNL